MIKQHAEQSQAAAQAQGNKFRLIILNVPHPLGFARELVNNPQQQKSSQYARNYQKEGAHLKVTVEDLAFWVADPEAKEKYQEAMDRVGF